MSGPLSGKQRGVCGEGEVNTRERHQVGLELVQVDVKRTSEPERSRDRGDNLGDQPVQVGETRLGNVQVLLADVKNGLVVHLRKNMHTIVTHMRVRKGNNRSAIK